LSHPKKEKTDRQNCREKRKEKEKEEFYVRIDVLTAMNMTIALFRAADTLKTGTKPFSETLLSLEMTTQFVRQKI